MNSIEHLRRVEYLLCADCKNEGEGPEMCVKLNCANYIAGTCIEIKFLRERMMLTPTVLRVRK